MDRRNPSKVFRSAEAAVSVVCDGASILFAGFGGAGCPNHLIAVLARQGVRNLTAITNDCGTGDSETGILFKNRQVKRVIASFPGPGSQYLQEQFAVGTIELELVPQGTLCERIRAAGAGIPAFYTPVGVGTEVGVGKEERSFEGRNYLMERALGADFAFLRAHRADESGNLVYRKAARNFNPVMAMAAKVTIVEVEEIVPVGELDPETIVTPGIFVDRIVAVKASADG
jgi:3-oxoadipate CoA-transferase alpha subunit